VEQSGNRPEVSSKSLSPKERAAMVHRIKRCVLNHHINVAGINYDAWSKGVDDRLAGLLAADQDEFEGGIRQLLSELGTSHTVFYHGGGEANPVLPQHSLNATLRNVTQDGSVRWMFLDVFEDGPAHLAGVKRGDLLFAVDGSACDPSAMPRFRLGQTYGLSISDVKGETRRDVAIELPNRTGTKQRPPILEPKPLKHAMIASGVGLLQIVYFPGAMGLGFAKTLDAAIADLKKQGCDRLIIDLRGNIGGSLGFARLASYMCAGRIPIGNSLTPGRLRKGYDREQLPRVPMPCTRAKLLFRLAQYAVKDKSLFLLTQGLGPQPFHGRIAVLVNEWTNSAAEMVASFASENRLATIVGTKTAGNVLGASNFKVGSGYWLRVPVFGWYTSQGNCLEGKGVLPDVTVEVEPYQLNAGVDQQMDKAIEIVIRADSQVSAPTATRV
jgi:carboxyl-terminal processing protease